MMIRVRNRDGLERVAIDNPLATVAQLKSEIETHLQVPTHAQILSTNRNLLLAKSRNDLSRFTDMSDPSARLSSLNVAHGSVVYLAYEGQRTVAGPAFHRAGSFGKKMTMDDLIAKQMRVTRQEKAHCELVSFDRDAANVFQHYVNESLAFAVKRGGLCMGQCQRKGKLRDPDEEKLVEATALGLGMRRVGFIFTQTISQNKKDYTMSNAEVLQAVELHTEGNLKEWVTAVVKLKENEDGGAYVHVEAFQLSDMCVRLFKEGWFEREIQEEVDPNLSRMKKDVVVGGKDTRNVDSDFFLVVLKISDHLGPLSSTFPIENRNSPVTMKALKNHLDRTKSLPFVKRISDFHLLLLIARFLDVNADVPALAACVQMQATVPEGYQLLIESLATAS
ncbi:UNVERIFIED_CONTAM: NPL4-like protein 1 [Sesamum angustifolium]|uniref:NPL4-like protein 1 n=1 Tax=Sesamum angustifolium TaxID=2727405 RepID=A0AAW2PTI1_9LAMI